MKITTKEVREITKILDDIVEEYKKETPKQKRNWRTYEQRVAQRLKIAFHELKPLVHEACKSITVVRGETRGAKPTLDLEQKVLLLLLKHLIQKSNRDMSIMLIVFSWLTDVEVSYKTIERLYSDQDVICALYNLHVLILKKKGVEKANCGGDGTGYALTVKKHYATEAQKLKDKVKDNSLKNKRTRTFIFSFRLIDIETRMYIATGTSFKSEQEAFLNALALAKETGISIKSARLDRNFSRQVYIKNWEDTIGKTKFFLIPKKNATVKGPWEWKKMLFRFVRNTKAYLHEYYQRNQSESGFAEDKKRCGWKLGQKREDRIDTADMLTSLWHNLYWLG